MNGGKLGDAVDASIRRRLQQMRMRRTIRICKLVVIGMAIYLVIHLVHAHGA